VVQPAQGVNPTPPLRERKPASPYAPAQEDPDKRGDYVAGGLFRPSQADSVPDEIPDVDAIPEPEVRTEPRARTGNQSYSVLGKRYRVLDSAEGYVEQGGASYYGKKFHGRRTSSGEVYDMYAFSAAHRSLPLPSYARVTNLDNGKSVVVRVNDRGPFHSKRIIDLSYAAAVKLGYRERGTARVEVRALTPGELQDAALAQKQGPGDSSAMDALVKDLPQAVASAGPADPAPATARPAAPRRQYRFDMRQDGKLMGADEFDVWMRSRQLRVPGTPGIPPRTHPVASAAVAAPVPAPPATQAVAVTDTVTLQVASFGSQQNAEHALGLLRVAAIDSARLLDVDVNGRRIWRLRIGPVDEARAPELVARLVGLGFGQPQRIRD
jgi:rare lipoprotein A